MSECEWCGTSFAPRLTGSPKRFCSRKHNNAWHNEYDTARQAQARAAYNKRPDVRKRENRAKYLRIKADPGLRAKQKRYQQKSWRQRYYGDPEYRMRTNAESALRSAFYRAFS